MATDASTLSRQPVVLDVESGIDDALAIMLALHLPQLQVLGLTCVAGNVDVDRVVANTGCVLEALVAEFNVRADPEAAAIVLQSGVPLTLYTLDVFRQSSSRGR